MFDLFSKLLTCGTVLTLAFLVLLALPQSKLRDLIMPFVGWSVAALSATYCVMPIDLFPEAFLGPFGYADDLIALVVAIGSASAAIDAGKSWKKLR
jgi:uncharacterized membrane protein YkvA (DUF1232 family)